MVLPPRLEAEPDRGGAIPCEDKFGDADVQLEIAELVPFSPPPSKELGEFVPEVPFEDMAENDEPADKHVESGLNPPGSISVAPSGMAEPLEPIVPSGEVGPIDFAPVAGAVIELWDQAASQLNRIRANRTHALRIETSCVP
jgi:hypothetical protein